jgi:iron complex transport system ATP-binding protein
LVRLAFEKVGVRYGARRVVGDVDLEVGRGEFLALVGANGSGKSSLARAAAGLQRHDGRVLRQGEDGAPARLSYMPQSEGRPPALRALEVVLLGRLGRLGLKVSDVDLAAAVAAMAELRIEALADAYVGELSGGQRQLVHLAQALASDPDILILDEPTSALDLRHQLDVLTILRDLCVRRGLCVLAILHDLNAAARFADRVAMIAQGTLRVCAEPRAALTREHLAAAFGVETAIGEGPDGRPTITPLRALR